MSNNEIDIVDRLHAMAADRSSLPTDKILVAEAANEIEQLRTLVDEYQVAGEQMLDAMAEASARNIRLEAFRNERFMTPSGFDAWAKSVGFKR